MPSSTTQTTTIQLPVQQITLEGELAIPDGARAIVVFAHGSGSSRHSPRNQFVAEELRNSGLATFLLDLLTPEEDIADQRTRALRFNIPMLGQRVGQVVHALIEQPATQNLHIGLFGASTGAAAALVAAAQHPAKVGSVVSRGGRPDLAADALPKVQAPTLLIVGGRDLTVLELNRHAIGRLNCTTQLETVPGATHLFEEPGALGQVAQLAADWFNQYLN